MRLVGLSAKAIASRPQVALIILTLITHRSVWEVAKQHGAYACLAKQFTSGDQLDKDIQRAIEFVRLMRKEERTDLSLSR